jgi:hypothetical protein
MNDHDAEKKEAHYERENENRPTHGKNPTTM